MDVYHCDDKRCGYEKPTRRGTHEEREWRREEWAEVRKAWGGLLRRGR